MSREERKAQGWMLIAFLFMLTTVITGMGLYEAIAESNACLTKKAELHNEVTYADNQRKHIRDYLKTKYRLHDRDAKHLADYILEASEDYKVPAKLLAAMVKTESNFNAHAVSHAGAYGIMQIMPWWTKVKHFQKATGIKHAQALFNPRMSIRAGAYILSHYVAEGGSLVRGVTMYNGGYRALKNPRVETVHYVSKVFKTYENI